MHRAAVAVVYECSLISHHTGATSSTLSNQIIAFTPSIMLANTVQITNMVTATFQDPERMDVENSGRRTRTQATKFAIGARG